MHSRFGSGVSGSSDSFIVVTNVSGQWEYDNGSALVPFTPLPTDVLVASVTFGSPSSVGWFIGASTFTDGIETGYGYYATSNGLLFTPTANEPGFTVSGTSFVQDFVKQVTQYGYDARDRQVYVVNPPDAQGNVTYTMTTYDNQDNVTETQQYQFEGEASQLWTMLAVPSGDPPSPLDNSLSGGDILLSQSTSQYNALGQVYQSSTYLVNNGQYVLNSQGSPIIQTTSTWYDLDGNQTETQDPLGKTTTYTYDGLDQQVSVTQPAVSVSGDPSASPVTTTIYDGDGNVTATIDPLDRVTATSYDGSDRQIASYQGQIITSSGRGYTSAPNPTWTFSDLSPNSQLTYNVYVELPAGIELSGYWPAVYSVSGGGGSAIAAATIDPTVPSMGAGWQLLGSVTVSATTCSLGISYTGGSADAPTAVCLLQQTSTTVYDAAGNVYSATNALGNTTTYTYDSLGQQLEEIQPAASPAAAQGVTQTIYDADGNVTATIDPMGRVTATTYDEFGQDVADYQGQVASTDSSGDWSFNNLSPDGSSCYDIYAYMGTGATSSVDPVSTDYTANGQKLAGADFTAPSLGGTWQLLGSVAVSPSTSTITVGWTSPDNGTTAPGEVVLLDETSSTTYNLFGDATSTSDALGNTTAYAYDNLDRQTTVTEPNPADGQDNSGSPVTQTVYDAAGNVSATIDPLGRVTAATYDSLGEQTAGYQGQAITNSAPPAEYSTLNGSPTWTFSNLAPNNVTPASAVDLRRVRLLHGGGPA